ncbi:MAG: hypothetical protein Q7J67_01175 [bacterium]|nr:hypothetical protein [bacterium]
MLEEFYDCNVSKDFLQGFPLKKYGYTFEARLNCKDSWGRKVVYTVLKGETRRFVSTTFPDEERHLRSLEIFALLKERRMFHPEVFQVCKKERTIVCHYIGEFLPPFLLGEEAYSAIDAVLDYLDLLDTMFPRKEIFQMPHILRGFLELSEQFPQLTPFISGTKDVLPKLRDKGICFCYGSGIEDPDIKNFRIVRYDGKFQALTTDYDCWSDRINYYWAIGYFYASLRWLAKASVEASKECCEYILQAINTNDRREEFMFWLGVLSGYCGYKRTLKKAIIEDRMNKFYDKLEIIKELDEKVSHLAGRLIESEEKKIANRDGLYLPTD